MNDTDRELIYSVTNACTTNVREAVTAALARAREEQREAAVKVVVERQQTHASREAFHRAENEQGQARRCQLLVNECEEIAAAIRAGGAR